MPTSSQKTLTQELQALEESLSPDERNAMRSYLQRCEVRLSTLHRIATAFIGGAGLMLLIPVFFKDAIDSIIEILLAEWGNVYPSYGETQGWIMTVVLYLVVAYPLILSLVIPLYGVYLLLKDIVHFYFTIYMPGFPPNLLNPTFALTGIAFSPDESPRVKREVMKYQYMPTRMDYMLPFSQSRRAEYFDRIIADTEGDIIPETRDLAKLRNDDIASIAITDQDVRRVGAAFGIARSVDRALVQEVAVAEMAVTRHVLFLRRLMLRYVKTLLMFIWTTVVSFIMLPFLKDERIPTFIVLSVAYLIWAVAAMPIMSLPINWIYRHRRTAELAEATNAPVHVDRQLRMFEDGMRRFAHLGIGLALVAVGLSILAELN